MYKKVLMLAAVFAALSVAIGAIGAHALESLLNDRFQRALETAARYQMYHSIALAICGILIYLKPNKLFATAIKLFITGIVLFSGSLYLLTFFYIQKINSLNFIGAITPLGGLCFIAGWICLALGTKKM